MSKDLPPSVDSLLPSSDGIRRLARSLVRDAALAEDVAQEAWLAALRRPPAAGWNPAAWFAGVARNLARKALRSSARRRRRERAAARAEAAPSTADVVGRIEVQARILAAVRALDEPYRSAIALRYLDGVPPREIAVRGGVPVATVRSWLRRGLERLRVTLDAAHRGDRRSWCAALLPLARRRASDLPPIAPVLAVRIGAVAAAVLAVAGTAAIALGRAEEGDVPGGGGVPWTAQEPPTPPPSPTATLAAVPRRRDGATLLEPEGPGWVSGRVFDTAERPVAGIRVDASGAPREGETPLRGSVARRLASPGEPAVAATAISGPDGRFVLKGLDDRRTYEVRAGERAEQVVVLRRGIAVSGRVIDDRDGGVVGARVVARSPDLGAPYVEAWMPFTATTGDDGAFRFEGLPPGAWLFEAVVPGLRAASDAPVRLVAGDGAPEVLLRLRRGASLAGRVLASDGAPAPGVAVGLAVPHQGESECAVSSPEGAFSFECLLPGTYEVFPLGSRRLAAVARDLAAAAQVDDVVVRLPSAYVTEGMLVDAGGKPVADRSVRVVSASPGPGLPFQASTRSGEDGGFRVEGLAPGRYTVQVDGVASDDVVEAGARGAVVHAPTGRSRVIEGRILAPDGSPCAAATLTVWTMDGNSGNGRATEVVGGHFRVERPIVRPGSRTWITVANARGADGAQINAQRLRVALLPEGPLELRLDPGHEVVGRVTDEGGAPVAAVRVSARALDPDPWDLGGTEGAPAADGSFRLIGLPAGTLRLSVSPPPPWLAPPASEVHADDREVVVRLGRGVRLLGLLTGPAGEPVSGWRIDAQDAAGMPLRERTARTAPDGTFAIDGLPPGVPVGLWARPDPAMEASTPYLRTQVVGLPAGGDPVSIRLRRGVFVEGRVAGPDGEPVVTGEVEVEIRWPSSADVRGYAWAWVGHEDGSFRVGPVEAGATRVRFWDPAGRWAPTPRTDVEAPATGVCLRTVTAVVLQGRIGGTSGRADAFWNPAEQRIGTGTDAEGRFTIRGLRDEPGLLYVAERDGDGYVLREGVTPSAGLVEATLEPGTTIEGRIEGLAAGESAATSVVAQRGALWLACQPAADGSFRLRAVPPGTYDLRLAFGPWSGTASAVPAGAKGVVLRAKAR